MVSGLARESLRTIWRFRLRSTLTLAVSALGIAGLVISVDYAAGGRQQVLNQIWRMGTNVIIVTPRQNRAIGGRARTGAISTTLIDEDYAAIRREISGIRRSSAVSSGNFRLKAGEFSKSCSIIGCESTYPAIKNWEVGQGAFFDAGDDRRLARVAVLGRTVAREMFGDESAIGRLMLINRVPFEIVGVMSERGQGLDVTNEDNQVYIPLRTAMRRLMNLDYYSGLIFELIRWDDMDRGASSIADTLRQRHKTIGKEPEDFQVQNQKSLIDGQVASAEKLGFFVSWIGISGLIVSGVGTLAIHWIALKHRTVEVGTRRAIGASAAHIFFQILIEVILISLAGGLVGLAVGWQCSSRVAAFAGLPFVFEQSNALLAIALSLLFNVSFSMLLSAKAARLDPIRALKYE